MDFRLLENRREGFIRYWVFQLRTHDCDPAIDMINYIFKRMEFNIEQRLWLCWLFAHSYYLPTAYVIWNEFPDAENIDQERLEWWNNLNYQKLRYQMDTRYNKGHLPEMFASYRKNVGESQLQFFQSLCKGTPSENYEVVRKKVVKDFHKFGRYLTWMYCQVLNECLSLPIEPGSLLLHDSGSSSHRDGLCYALGLDDWTSKFYIEGKKQYREIKYDEDKVAVLQSGADSIIQETKQRFPDIASKTNYFRMETALCSFKKLFRQRDGRYLGYYLDRQLIEIKTVEADNWMGIDWELLYDYRKECLLPELGGRDKSINKLKMKDFLQMGNLTELEWYSDLL
jgi:hypothetical protein